MHLYEVLRYGSCICSVDLAKCAADLARILKYGPCVFKILPYRGPWVTFWGIAGLGVLSFLLCRQWPRGFMTVVAMVAVDENIDAIYLI